MLSETIVLSDAKSRHWPVNYAPAPLSVSSWPPISANVWLGELERMAWLFVIPLLLILGSIAALLGGLAFKLLHMLFGNKRENPTAKPAPDLRHQRARAQFEAELKAMKNAEKQSKGRRNWLYLLWNLASFGAGFITYGIADQFNLGQIIGVGAWFLVSAILAMIGVFIVPALVAQNGQSAPNKAPARPVLETPPTLAGDSLPQGQADLVNRILKEGTESLKAMDAAGLKLRSPDSRATLAQLVGAGHRILRKIAADPDLLNEAQRLFTYYGPEAVKLVNGLAEAENRARPDLDRLMATQTLLKKLASFFDRTELDLAKEDARALDIDVRLLDQALEADLKTLA